MIVVENNIARSTTGKLLNVKKFNTTFDSVFLSPGTTIDDLCEVDPPVDYEYEDAVNELIRQRYTLSEELAILRQRDIKADEFAVYNEYCEQCKLQAREMRTDE